MKSLFVALLVLSSQAFAQTETPPPQPKTDEYGIPLKLKATPSPESLTPGQTAPKKQAPMDSLAATPRPATAVLSGMQTEPKPKFDSAATSKPIPEKYKLRKTAPSKQAAAGKKKKSKSPAPQVVEPEVLENQATKELMLEPTDLTTGVLPTPATVRSRVEEVKNPVRPLAYRLGLSLQPFTPKGTMKVGDLQAYNMSDVGTGAMLALDGQWLPIHFENTPELMVGPFVSVGYAQFNLNLRSPTGLQLEDTKLHLIKAQVGASASYQLPKSPLWSLHGNLGIGRLLAIQSSSSSSSANASSSVDFASLGIAGERSLLPKLSAYIAYDLRIALEKTDQADVPNHNVIVGFLGNFE